jgi:hypothetical protein
VENLNHADFPSHRGHHANYLLELTSRARTHVDNRADLKSRDGEAGVQGNYFLSVE